MMKRNARVLAVVLGTMLMVGLPPAGADDDQAKRDRASAEAVGRPVRVVSIAFGLGSKSVEVISKTVDAEGAKGTDIILLPELWTGTKTTETLDGPAVSAMAALAKKHKTYICCPIDRWDEQKKKRYNSAVLLDRQGKVACVYDKIFPTTVEFRKKPPRQPGDDTIVYEADFGQVGFAICFDVAFPEVWHRLADQGAELVLWASAYSAGSSLQAHALNHQYYIVTSTGRCDCTVCDITGEIILFEKKPPINVSRITLDLDRGIYSTDFNIAKRDKMLKEHPDDVIMEKWMPRECWFVIKAKRPGVSARKLATQYGLEELRPQLTRSRRAADKRRGWKFSEKLAEPD